jgi:hypothetical protein
LSLDIQHERALEKFEEILKGRLKLRNFEKVVPKKRVRKNSNVVKQIQLRDHKKKKNVEECMYFLQGATWHLTKKCKYVSDVI